MIEAEFYTALKGQIGSLNAYPVLASKNATAPFVVYQRISTIRDRTVSSVARMETTYRVDIYHTQLLAAQNIAKDIATGLSSYSTDPIRYITIDNEQDASDISGDPALYRWIMEIRVIHSPT